MADIQSVSKAKRSSNWTECCHSIQHGLCWVLAVSSSLSGELLQLVEFGPGLFQRSGPVAWTCMWRDEVYAVPPYITMVLSTLSSKAAEVGQARTVLLTGQAGRLAGCSTQSPLHRAFCSTRHNDMLRYVSLADACEQKLLGLAGGCTLLVTHVTMPLASCRGKSATFSCIIW
jgi:hypothetical protein